jgi:hypothetical protein
MLYALRLPEITIRQGQVRPLPAYGLRADLACASVQLVAEPNIYDIQVGNVPVRLIPSLGP